MQEQSVPILTAFAFSSTGVFQNFKKCLFKYNNREYVLHAGTPEYCDVIQTYITHNDEYNEIFTDLNQFLHNFGWFNQCGFQYKIDAGQGSKHTNDLYQRNSILQAKRSCAINLAANFEYISNPSTPETTIALSLYNDAQVSNNYFYEFLCLFKILEIDYPNKNNLYASQWINQTLINQPSLIYHDFIKDMVVKKEDVGTYFYKECRTTIAHINNRNNESLLSFKLEDYQKIRIACNSIDPFVRYFIHNVLGLSSNASKIEILQIE